MGGGESTAEKYAKFGAGEYTSSDFESYVDSRPDLAAAWSKIESDPTAWDSKYWIDKGATSKAAFGRAHAAEDAELYAGTYGDAGDTKVLPGTDAYDSYFGDGSGTYFDEFIARPSGDSGGGGGGSSAPYAANPFFPQLVPEYTPQGLLDWSAYMPAGGLFGHEQYQPWTNPNAIPENLFYYQPPTIHAGGGISGGGYSGVPSRVPSGVSSGVPSGVPSGGSSGSVSYTPVGNISAGSSSSDGDVYTPFMGDAPVLGTQGKDTGHTLEELVIMSDPSTSVVPTTFPVLNATSELQAEMANQIINQHVTQGLIDYKPELAADFATVGLGGDYQYDQAQARIEQAALDLLKAQPKAILGGNLSTGSPVSMIWSGRQAANREGSASADRGAGPGDTSSGGRAGR